MKNLASFFGGVLLLCAGTPLMARTVTDSVASLGGRQVPVTIIVPDKGRVKGVVLFSHGALSSPKKYSELITPWSKHGFAIIAPLHADSTDWMGTKAELKDQTAWRLADMAAATAALPDFGRKAGFKPGNLPLIAAGHSFGALIAMSMGETRIVSVIAFSPPGPIPGITLPKVAKPMFTVTGTADAHPMMAPKWDDHLTAHRQSIGFAWAYAGTGADHYFGGVFGRPELAGPKQSEAFAEALMLSERFLEASLAMDKDRAAVSRLELTFKNYRPKSGTLSAR